MLEVLQLFVRNSIPVECLTRVIPSVHSLTKLLDGHNVVDNAKVMKPGKYSGLGKG